MNAKQMEECLGTEEFIKACISVINNTLISNGITTEEKLRSDLDTEFICRFTNKVKDDHK